jgi:predicted Zn-dependent peptidase
MTSSFPLIQSPTNIQFLEPEVYALDNGIAVYGFNGARKDIVKVSLLFDAGRWAESVDLSASFCANLIKSGTKQYTAYALEEAIDFSGSTIKTSAGYNSFTIDLFCLTRYLKDCLPILVDVLNNTTFPESEIEHSRSKRLASLKVNELKNDFVGEMTFKQLLFGDQHPYGYTTTIERIEAVDRAAILNYYTSRLHQNKCTISIAGKYSSNEIDLLNRYLGNHDYWNKTVAENTASWKIEPSKEKKKVLSIPKSVQASINIGNITIDRTHPDAFNFAFLNMIYGGYFGSRLMTNIREEKGLTYGIYSYIQKHKHASAFIINTDTAIENIDECLKEIYFEMTRLKEELIGEEEMLKARNYYLGRMLDQADGPFKVQDTFMSLKNHGLSFDFLKKMVHSIQTMEAISLQKTAEKYFNTEEMFEVIVQ